MQDAGGTAHGLAYSLAVAHVGAPHLESAILIVLRQIAGRAGDEIIYHAHVAASREELVDEVAADKAGAAGYDVGAVRARHGGVTGHGRACAEKAIRA